MKFIHVKNGSSYLEYDVNLKNIIMFRKQYDYDHKPVYRVLFNQEKNETYVTANKEVLSLLPDNFVRICERRDGQLKQKESERPRWYFEEKIINLDLVNIIQKNERTWTHEIPQEKNEYIITHTFSFDYYDVQTSVPLEKFMPSEILDSLLTQQMLSKMIGQ